MDTRVLSNQRVAWFAGPASSVPAASYESGPTLAQLQSLTNISEATKIDGTDFNIEGSEQSDDRSFLDAAGSQSRSYDAASGNIEIYTPAKGDTTSIFAETWDILSPTRTPLTIAQRVVKQAASPLEAGDEINLFSVLTDERVHNRNDVSRTLGIGLVLQGNMLVNYIVPSETPTAPAVTVENGADLETLAVDDVAFVTVEYEGRNITVGATYVSSDEGVFRVLSNGVILATGIGTATLTVSYPGAAAVTPITVTVA